MKILVGQTMSKFKSNTGQTSDVQLKIGLKLLECIQTKPSKTS